MRTIALLLLFSCVTGCGTTIEVPPAGTYLPELCAVVGVLGVNDPLGPQPAPPAPAPPAPGPAPTPVTDTCPNCNGKGTLGDGRTVITCPVCDGSGKVTKAMQAYIDHAIQTAEQLQRMQANAVIGNKRLAELAAEVEELKKPVEKPPEIEATTVPSGLQSSALDWHHELKPAREEATADGRPMLVHWWAEWCGPCRNMQKMVFDNQAVIDELPELVVICKMVAANQGEKPSQTQKSWNVTGIPTDFVTSPDYKKKIRLANTVDAQTYLRNVRHAAEEVQAYIDSTKVDVVKPVIHEVVVERPTAPAAVYFPPGSGGGWGGGYEIGGCSSCSGGSCW